ncbi:MAG: cation-translocating P-type ATPase [Phycisphaerae bacterium]|nr:cation-translocating P-type ATPase [Phycisphaerae bacterium]
MGHEFDLQSLIGLTEEEAARRLGEEGYNELPGGQKRGILRIALEVIREPMFLLLVGCGTVYLLMGREYIGDALMLLGFVFVVMGITVVQERRTERAVEALRDLSSPRALVIRDGRRKRIAGREVARGDILILAEGDRVPADAVLRHALSLSANESLLTGESVPVRKSASGEALAMPRPGGDDLPFVYSGTLISSGQGVAEVLATGLGTELGKIGRSLQGLEQEQTPLQRETARLVRNLAAFGLAVCAVVVVIYALTRGDTGQTWKEGLLVGLTMAMATLPEELPVVLTVFLALGAWRISKKQVLTRRMPAIETLGAATVLCVDKTGTLTLNQMSVQRLYAGGAVFDVTDRSRRSLPERFHELLEFGILASKREPFDPMEKALRQVGDTYLAKTEHLHENWTLEHEYPLSPQQLALSHVWRSTARGRRVVACKGAPEAIADLCHLDEAQTRLVLDQATAMANDGLRVLGVAKGLLGPAGLPQTQHDVHFDFVGLVGMADPIRPTVPATVKECYGAGIRVVMITGDYPGTAVHIARQIGLKSPQEVITGPELDQMGDEQLQERIDRVNLFARVVPEQKLRIVQALKARHEIVAMTGDGVNDAPALKAAHIGVAMGGRGTDVAREAAALVLLDDDFSSIVAAVKLGRRIFDNIKKAVSYVFAVHVPILGLSVIPVIMGDWPVILMAVHVVFLELIIDPACSVIFEAEREEPDVMDRPPRDPQEGLFTMRSLGLSLIQGFGVLAVVLAVFVVSRWAGHAEADCRALTFVTLVVSNLCLILTNRSWSRTILTMFKEPNAALWWVAGGAVVFISMVLFVPFLRELFHFSRLHAGDLMLCLGAGVASIGWFEVLKIATARRRVARA